MKFETYLNAYGQAVDESQEMFSQLFTEDVPRDDPEWKFVRKRDRQAQKFKDKLSELHRHEQWGRAFYQGEYDVACAKLERTQEMLTFTERENAFVIGQASLIREQFGELNARSQEQLKQITAINNCLGILLGSIEMFAKRENWKYELGSSSNPRWIGLSRNPEKSALHALECYNRSVQDAIGRPERP